MKLEMLLSVVPLAIVAALFQSMPLLTRRGIYFSASVEPNFPSSDDGRRLLRSYRLQAALWTLAALVLAALLVPAHPEYAALVPMLVLMVGIGFSYWLKFDEVHSRFGLRKPEVRETSLATSSTSGNEKILAQLVLPPFLAIGAVAFYLHTHWSELPLQFPVHWSITGQPNRWASRDFAGVYGPLLVGTIMNLLFLAFAWALTRISRKSIMRQVTIRMLQVLLYPVTFSFLVVSALPLVQQSGQAIPALTWLAPAVTLAFTAGLLYWSYRKITAPAAADETPEPQSDSNWKLGLIYWNPQDPAIFVSKRVGIGFTMNFANRTSWFVLAGILLITLLPGLLLKGK